MKYKYRVNGGKHEYEVESSGLDLAAWEVAKKAKDGSARRIEVTNELGCTMIYHGCTLGDDGLLHYQRRERKDND